MYFNLICSFASMVSIDYCFTVADFFSELEIFTAQILTGCVCQYLLTLLLYLCIPSLCVYHVLSCDSAAVLQKQITLTVSAVEFIQWDSQMSTEMTVMLSPHQGSPPDSSLVVSITSLLKPWNSVVGTFLCCLMVPQPNMYLFEWSELSYTPKNGT